MLDIEKQFPGVKALDHAKLQLRPGSSTPSWRERRRKIDACEVPVRYL